MDDGGREAMEVEGADGAREGEKAPTTTSMSREGVVGIAPHPEKPLGTAPQETPNLCEPAQEPTADMGSDETNASEEVTNPLEPEGAQQGVVGGEGEKTSSEHMDADTGNIVSTVYPVESEDEGACDRAVIDPQPGAKTEDVAASKEPAEREEKDAVPGSTDASAQSAAESIDEPKPTVGSASSGGEMTSTEGQSKKQQAAPVDSSPLPADEVQEHARETDEATSPSHALDREIIFDESADAKQKAQGWTNGKWSAASSKSLEFTAPILRVLPGRFFWSPDVYEKRVLAIYSNPDVILVLRLPKDADEVRHLLPSEGGQKSSGQDVLVVESVADPKACKIRLSQLTTPTSVPGSYSSVQNDSQKMLPNNISMNMAKKSDHRRRSCFDILTPAEMITLSAAFLPADSFDDIEYTSEKSLNETHRCEDALVSAVINAHGIAEQASWKHQMILGTLHSYVFSGNDQLLKESLASALDIQRSRASASTETSRIESSIIDAKDDDGKTALHYACSRRKNSTVQILINAGANGAEPQNSDGFTPCHICSMKLDEKILSIILSARHPVRPSPNDVDTEGRTPMYLAAVAGKGVGSKSNAIALDLCLSALEAWGGQFFVDSLKSKELLHPVHCISAQWKYEELEVILSHCSYRYPLKNESTSGISLSAHFQYPIHAALLSLRDRIQSAFAGTHDTELMPQTLVKTLQVLFEHGFEPNERIEGIVGQGPSVHRLLSCIGFAPIQILALSAADVRDFESKAKAPDAVRFLRNAVRAIQDALTLMLKSGARTSLPPPPLTRLDRATPPGCYSLKEVMTDQMNEPDQTDAREKATLNGKDAIMTLLGPDRVKRAQKAFVANGKTVDNFGALKVESSGWIESDAPGGSDSNSCSICWSEFGVISNRRHTCRVSCRHVCHECSTKRLIVNGTEHRISDGQYLLSKAAGEKAAAKSVADREERMRRQRESVTQARKSLELNSEGDADGGLSTKDRISNVISSLGQTKNAVLERGSKLESLAEKTAALEQASMDFANIAKELNRSQNSWW